jgi:Fe-S cluster assembly protein SufB
MPKNPSVINYIINKKYTLGFSTLIKTNMFPKGLNNFIIQIISKKQKEPLFLLKFRLKAYTQWKISYFPTWANLKILPLNYNDIRYLSKPIKKKNTNIEILKTFNKLGVFSEKSNIAIDAVFDSISIITTFKEKLAKLGIIFCSLFEAIKEYPFLVNKYLGSIVTSNDNFFASLNSAIFSDGSFCFIPQNTICPMELSTYFRINDKEAGQFERTLIIAEKNSIVNYFEGCSAPIYNKNQLHTAIVELLALDNSKIYYSTIQNWYSGDEKGLGGIYNFVTKRGLCIGKNSEIHWTQVETGSSITWKYPSCILIGSSSKGSFYSITLTKNYQQSDTGTKMIHLGKETKSKILSKSISCNSSKNTYRGLVKIAPNAYLAKNFSQCDSFIIGSLAITSAYPYFDVKNFNTYIEHEATISKISEEQLVYLRQRGLNQDKAVSLIITGFCKEIYEKLPLEFAIEAKDLLKFNF